MEISLRLVWIVIWETATQESLVNSERHCLACARICLDSLNSGRILGENQRSPDSESAHHAGFGIERRGCSGTQAPIILFVARTWPLRVI